MREHRIPHINAFNNQPPCVLDRIDFRKSCVGADTEFAGTPAADHKRANTSSVMRLGTIPRKQASGSR